MPEVRLDASYAAELAEMLQFLTGWLARDPARLATSLDEFVGNSAHGIQDLRGDLERFICLKMRYNPREFFSSRWSLMKRRSTARPKPSSRQGQPVLPGLETALGEAAYSAAVKALSPVTQRLRSALDHRALQRELRQGPSLSEIDAFLASVSPEVAQELIAFLSSAEMRNVAFSVAIESVLGRCGKKSNQLSKQLRIQVRSLLTLTTSLKKDDLDAAAEVIFSAMSTAVTDKIAELLHGDKPFSRTTKASVLKLQDSFTGSVIRNSEVLAKISSLASFKAFEDEFNLQVRNLYGTMRLPHAGATRRVPYEKLYVQPTVRFIKQDAGANTLTNEHLNVPDRVTVEDLAKHVVRVVLLGDPGGGKSTLSVKLAYDCASGTK